MMKQFFALILASALFSPMVAAQEDYLGAGAYGGLAFGQLSSEEIDTGNLGIALGNIAKHGFGYEFFYNFSIVDDKSTQSGVDITAKGRRAPDSIWDDASGRLTHTPSMWPPSKSRTEAADPSVGVQTIASTGKPTAN